MQQLLPKIGVLCNSTLGIPSIHALLSNKLVAAIGMPDTVHHDTIAIDKMAKSFGIDTVTLGKKDLKNDLSQWIDHKKLDVVLVFTFPWKIPHEILTIPKFGFINFHFGLLPQYRGADAIFWTIKNKEKFGGISVHQMDAEFDTGPLLHVERVQLLSTDTYGMHVAKLSNININVLQKILPTIFAGKINTITQQANDTNYYKKQTIEDITINWDKQSSSEIIALINACNPWNKGAYTSLNGMPLRITEAIMIDDKNNGTKVGEIVSIDKEGISVQCIDNTLLAAKVITLEEGIYSAKSFAEYCGIKPGQGFDSKTIKN